jgi:NitT/TauT family transport system substrate-binding protein
MPFSPRRMFIALIGTVVLAFPFGLASPASAQTKIKFVLNWKYQGPQGMFFLAEDRGYYKAEGLEVTIDQGNGSGAAVPLVANGTYDAGFGDINALIELAGRKPEDAPIAVYVMFNQPPFTVAVRADSPIKSPKDFEGKTLGGAANDAALKLFPALCKIAKIDCSKVNLTNMQPNLREQMLMQGQVDGVFGYVNTIRFSAKLMGVEDKQLRYINYGDYGMDLYSNGIIVSKKLAKEKPEAVRGLVRAIAKAMREVVANPDAAVELLAAKEPLIDKSIEKRRLLYVVKTLIDTPEARARGVGDIDDDRMARAVTAMVEAYELPRTPGVGEVFNRAFLPAKAERALPASGN